MGWYELAGMRVSISVSEAMVLCRKMLKCFLQVGSELLSKVKESKYLGVLFIGDGKMDCKMDRQIGAVSTVMPP